MLERSYSILVQKTRANKLVLFGFDQFQGAFVSTCFIARGLALFQQFVENAGSLDSKKQDLKVAQSVNNDSATGPLQNINLNSQRIAMMIRRCFQLLRITGTSCLRPGE